MLFLRSAVTASLLLVLLVTPVRADHYTWFGDATPATVSGYGSSFPGRIQPETWGPDCEAVYPVISGGHVLEEDYGYAAVVHETIEGPNAITLFREPKAGTIVWPDTDGDGEFDYASNDGAEQGAKAIILCSSVPAPVLPATDSIPTPPSASAPLLPFGLLLLVSTVVIDRLRHRGGPSTGDAPGD